MLSYWCFCWLAFLDLLSLTKLFCHKDNITRTFEQIRRMYISCIINEREMIVPGSIVISPEISNILSANMNRNIIWET